MNQYKCINVEVSEQGGCHRALNQLRPCSKMPMHYPARKHTGNSPAATSPVHTLYLLVQDLNWRLFSCQAKSLQSQLLPTRSHLPRPVDTCILLVFVLFFVYWLKYEPYTWQMESIYIAVNSVSSLGEH